MRLSGRGSAAEEDTNTEHRIRIIRIARTKYSPGFACGRGRIVESQAVRKSRVKPGGESSLKKESCTLVRLKTNSGEPLLSFSRSLSALEQIYIPDERL
jgi:hypothetical protein